MQKFHLFLIVAVFSCDIDEAAKAFKSKQIRDPIFPYTKNPYEIVDPNYLQKVSDNLKDTTSVCAIKYDDYEKQMQSDLNFRYHLKQFNSKEEAEENQFIVTHQGKCGACSTLQDLAVYLTTDLTRPVRKCGLMYGLSQHYLLKCIKGLGFTDTCAQVWLYNTLNTKKSCFWPCMQQIHPNSKSTSFLTNEDFVKNGKLNKCLQCDEDISGPIFKYESGRTRRNSGIKSEIDRPDDQIYDITHCYY
ncbi:unnamed protein product (macronuclear) [Paramecium tetraurelia]|uniref:Uncharacterized protein n=1 Tax=Paramecium tetraurelia TaxID=5888 RepID=A0ECP4_PARTE|nr:uncharacterized protein GSPATT00003930001 [Paramecium tetraurelia]CAK93061.1 unnamed protein product [Paramecium tetraurelia]|eukprot:XP_001460458.1 hypothetical protein (macronuclear) [Paramecium tetraurelia strain d4-2]